MRRFAMNIFFGFVFFSMSGQVNADIITNFASVDGLPTGASDFTLVDPDNPNFTATFESPGEIVFFAVGPLYMNSNRAFGLEGGSGPTFAEIIFDTHASIVTIMGRDTNGQVTGGPSVSEPSGTVLPLALGMIEAFDANQVSLGTFEFPETEFAAVTFEGNISRLVITNSGPENSYALIGGFSATAIPEPSCIPIGLALCIFLIRRR